MSSSIWHGRNCCDELLCAIEECEAQWHGDPAYKEVLYKLAQVEQELDLITASPGHRAALRAHSPKMSGQIPTEEHDEQMEVQRSG